VISVRFYIDGKKTQGIGYRVHIASLAIISGVERLYAENLPIEGGREKVAVYASAKSRKKLDLFYQRVKQKIPPAAVDVSFSKLEPYHSEVTIPPVNDFVALLNVNQLTEGIATIRELQVGAIDGFKALGEELGGLHDDLKTGLKSIPRQIGSSVVTALTESGVIEKKRKGES
jgi:hypothetical protein